jgi:dihydroorotate dehydrogenase electron transfer subunit
LGHGFTVPEEGGETPMLVAGGYGMAAMFLLAQRSPQKGIVFVGGRRRVDILCEREFAAIGWEIRVTTEDGSHGEKGMVTHPLIAELKRRAIPLSSDHSPANEARAPHSALRTPHSIKIFACGPTPMLKAVGKIAEEFNVPAELSMDEHMCCGVGVCLTCVIPVKSGAGWEYQRTCTEGPVFDSRDMVWKAA